MHGGEIRRSVSDMSTSAISWWEKSVQKLRRTGKQRAGCHTSEQFIFLALDEWAGLDPTAKPLSLIFSPPFCFFLFSLFTIRVVYRSLASHIWITLTHFSSLDWKQCLVFPKPLGHEMHAGCNPKRQSEPRERQAGEEGKTKGGSN